MAAEVILARLEAKGVRLRREGDSLIATPRERLTDELRGLIREHKAELLQAIERPSRPAQLRGLVAMIYAKDTPEDQAEAVQHALSDPCAALECYRLIASKMVH